MKRTAVIAVGVIIAVVAVFVIVRITGNRSGNAYKLAVELKNRGLDYETVKFRGSTAMYEEIFLKGRDIEVSINYYGNGLFLKQVTDNLEKNKKRADPNEPIYAAGAYIVVVHKEPVKDKVKSILQNIFRDVKQY